MLDWDHLALAYFGFPTKRDIDHPWLREEAAQDGVSCHLAGEIYGHGAIHGQHVGK